MMTLQAPAIVRSKTFWTPQRRLWAGRSPGRRPGRLPGGRIDDLVGMRKAIMLCQDCKPKFNATAAGYVTKSSLPFVRGRCDGCERYVNRAHLFVHHLINGG